MTWLNVSKKFENTKFDKFTIRKHAESFDEKIFKAKIECFIKEKNIEFKKKKNGW